MYELMYHIYGLLHINRVCNRESLCIRLSLVCLNSSPLIPSENGNLKYFCVSHNRLWLIQILTISRSTLKHDCTVGGSDGGVQWYSDTVVQDPVTIYISLRWPTWREALFGLQLHVIQIPRSLPCSSGFLSSLLTFIWMVLLNCGVRARGKASKTLQFSKQEWQGDLQFTHFIIEK